MILGTLPSMKATAELVVPVKTLLANISMLILDGINARLTQIDTDHGALDLGVGLGGLIPGEPGREGGPRDARRAAGDGRSSGKLQWQARLAIAYVTRRGYWRQLTARVRRDASIFDV